MDGEEGSLGPSQWLPRTKRACGSGRSAWMVALVVSTLSVTPFHAPFGAEPVEKKSRRSHRYRPADGQRFPPDPTDRGHSSPTRRDARGPRVSELSVGGNLIPAGIVSASSRLTPA